MKPTFLPRLIAASIVFASALLARADHSAVDSAPRGDQGWKDRQALLNKRAAEAGEKAKVIFIGDSITQGWEGEGKEVWAERYAKYDAVNLGIGGDRTQHVLWRLENGNIDGLKPKAAVVMIGTNNSNGEDNSVEQIAEGVAAIVKKLRAKLPSTRVLLLAIFPRGENPNPQRGKLCQINQIISKLADGDHVQFLDFGHKFIDEKGRIPRELMPDYLHLTKQAYQIWADSIDGALKQALGASGTASASLKGEWIATMPGPNQEPVDVPFTIDSAADGSIKGRFHAQGRDLEITEGKLSGGEFAWTVKRERSSGGTMVYKMTGQLKGETIVGQATTGFQGEEAKVDWTARRK